MQISYYDISDAAENLLNYTVSFLKQSELQSAAKNNTLSETAVKRIAKKFSDENIFATEHSRMLLLGLITEAISQYHLQLREKLLESGIDIGEMDMRSSE